VLKSDVYSIDKIVRDSGELETKIPATMPPDAINATP
jgi:hypothetical protein